MHTCAALVPRARRQAAQHVAEAESRYREQAGEESAAQVRLRLPHGVWDELDAEADRLAGRAAALAAADQRPALVLAQGLDRKSTRLNSSHT